MQSSWLGIVPPGRGETICKHFFSSVLAVFCLLASLFSVSCDCSLFLGGVMVVKTMKLAGTGRLETFSLVHNLRVRDNTCSS